MKPLLNRRTATPHVTLDRRPVATRFPSARTLPGSPRDLPTQSRSRAASRLPWPARHRDGLNPSPLSSSSIVPGTTRQHTNGLATALPRRPPHRFGGLLLAALSHATGFQAPGRPRQAPVTTPAPAALPGLVMVVHRSFTSLGGVTPRVFVVCPRLPPGHSLHATVFDDGVISAGRNEKRPLIPRRRSFAVRHRLRPV